MATLVVPVSCVSHGGLEHTGEISVLPDEVTTGCWDAVLLLVIPISLEPILQLAVVAVFVVPVSWVSDGGLLHTCCTRPMLAEAVVVVLVVPVTCVSQGGLEHILAEATVGVLVVPVSWVSQGGFEQTRVTSPGASLASAPVEEGCSEVGDARMETGRSCTGCASTPLGVLIRVT